MASETSRRKFLNLIGTTGVVATAAGCVGGGGGDTDGGETPGEDTPTETETPTQQTETSQTNELVFAINEEYGSLDPAKHADLISSALSINFYDPLVFIDPDTRGVTDHLATDWTTENDGKTWVFTLRDDVTFHSGNALTADDVVYSMNRMLEIGQGLAGLWTGRLSPGDIVARDDTTVAFNLNETFGPFLPMLVHLFVVDSVVVQENESEGEFGDHGDYGQAFLNEDVAGSGPYELDELLPEEVVMAAFEDYWGGWEDDQIDLVRYKTLVEESTIKSMMRTDRAQMASQYMSPQSFADIDSYDNSEVIVADGWTLFHLPMNTQIEPTDDINVRKAIAYALNSENSIQDILGGGAPAAGPVPATMPGFNDELSPRTQNFEKAEEALQAASYSVDEINEIGIEIVHVPQLAFERKLALLLKQNLSELGITNVEINPTPWPQITERVTDAETTPHLTELLIGVQYPSPDAMTYTLFHPSSFGTYQGAAWYSTDEIQSVLEDARSTPETAERLEKYKEAQKLIHEGYPSLFVAHLPIRRPKSTSVEGWTYYGIQGFDVRFYDLHQK